MMVIIIVLFLVFCLVGWAGYLMEKKDYNGGKCPHCLRELGHFDTDSQGGSGYVCDGCGYDTWVSYPFIEVKVRRC